MNIIDNDFPIDPNDVALSKLTIVYKREFDCTQCEVIIQVKTVKL